MADDCEEYQEGRCSLRFNVTVKTRNHETSVGRRGSNVVLMIILSRCAGRVPPGSQVVRESVSAVTTSVLVFTVVSAISGDGIYD